MVLVTSEVKTTLFLRLFFAVEMDIVKKVISEIFSTISYLSQTNMQHGRYEILDS